MQHRSRVSIEDVYPERVHPRSPVVAVRTGKGSLPRVGSDMSTEVLLYFEELPAEQTIVSVGLSSNCDYQREGNCCCGVDFPRPTEQKNSSLQKSLVALSER